MRPSAVLHTYRSQCRQRKDRAVAARRQGFRRPASYDLVQGRERGIGDRPEMRSGGCTVQQELAGDAAAVMRQAVTLARRRGHAQVTPLHAASAMLADAGGLLRAACLRSRAASSHPLQCKALELCFNVALNRLATASAAVMFPSFHAAHHRPPALSNALAAAFKRAQANQRRGGGGVSPSPDGQHVAIARVELEQLVISILDDPGVSRVMREAGFSSAEVKANVEKAAVMVASSSSPEQSSNTAASSTTASPPNHPKPSSNSFNKSKAVVDFAGEAARVLDCMVASGGGQGQHRRCVAVVGESAEAVVKAVMDMVSKGGDLMTRLQHERLKGAQFLPFSAASFHRSPREEVEARVADLRALVREATAAGKGVVLVLEDLGYAAEAWSSRGRGRYGYCPVEHAIMELGGLVRGDGHDMFWLLGFGSYASYASCRSGQPSLEAVLDLHPVVVPDGGSLGGDSEITHCGADMVMAAAAAAASVPSWIRRYQQQGPTVLAGSELTLSFSSPASSSHYYDANMSYEPWHHGLIDRRHPLPNHGHGGPIMAADSCDQRLLFANPNNPGSSRPSSVSRSNSSDGATAAQPATAARRRRKFTELTAENLKVLCGALEARVPRHRDIAPSIVSAVLRRRSGVTRTARPSSATWLLFRGRDSDGKTAMARELARLVFGSYADFTSIAAASPSEITMAHSPGSNSGDSLKRQRSPDGEYGGYMQRFYEAIRENPHRVVMIDGSGAERDSMAGIKYAMATGMVRGCDDDVVISLEDAIIVSCDEGFESMSRVSSTRAVKQQRAMTNDVDGKVEDVGAEKGLGLDLNACAAMDGEEGSCSPNDMEILKAVDGVFLFRY
ncbi:unnamed protein product [Urochloa humidicola]